MDGLLFGLAIVGLAGLFLYVIIFSLTEQKPTKKKHDEQELAKENDDIFVCHYSEFERLLNEKEVPEKRNISTRYKKNYNPLLKKYRVTVYYSQFASKYGDSDKLSWIEETEETLIELHRRIYQEYNYPTKIFITKLSNGEQ